MSHTGGCLTRSDCRSSTGGGSSGRPSARLVAAAPQQWRSFEAVAELFDGPQDTEWETDRDRIDQAVRDPWTVRAILDTSVVIATDVGPLQRELAINSATLAELHFGVLVATDAGVRAERLRRLPSCSTTSMPCLLRKQWRRVTGGWQPRS